MSETSERVLVSNAEGRGGKSYWIREAMRLAGEVATLEAKLDSVLGLFGDFDHTPTVEECRAIWNSLMKERGQDKAKLGAIERAAFKLHEGVERFTVTNAELSDEMYILRQAIGYDRMSQLRAAAQEEKEDE